jgi:ABC-type amino acid transport substrate-binding protein
MRVRFLSLAASIAVCAAMILAAASGARAKEQSRLDVVVQRGKLIVVTLTTAPPYAFKDEKGDLVGFDVDIAHLIANALFKDPEKIEFISVTSDGRWPAIESGRADLGMGGTTTYMDRALHVAFEYVDHGQQDRRDQIPRRPQSGEIHSRDPEQSANGGSGKVVLSENQSPDLRYAVE